MRAQRRASDAAYDAELQRRGLAPVAPFDFAKHTHAKQAKLVKALLDRTRRYLAVLAGRQSGKSHGGAMGALLLARQMRDVAILYVTSTDASVRKMAFEPAKRINRKLKLGGRCVSSPNPRVEFPNGAVVYFVGADGERTIERLRGTPNLVLCIIDECGLYDSDKLKQMIEAVTPGLRPLSGALVLMGTPSLAGAQGTWFDATQNPSFEQHRFNYLDNDRVPSFVDVERLIDEELAALGYTRQSAYFLREYLCEFVVELAEKVYQLTEANLYDGEPPADLDVFAVGGDLGTSAHDALLTVGWRKRDPSELWEVESKTAPGQDSLEFGVMARDVWKRRTPISIVVDPGGLGVKTIKTVKGLYPDMPIEAAEKPEVNIQVRAVNLLLEGRVLKLRRGGQLARELASPTWAGGVVGSDIDEHGRHSDLVPALRYVVLKVTKYLRIKPPIIAMSAKQVEAAEQKKLWKPKAALGLPDPLAPLYGPRRAPGNFGWGSGRRS